MSIFRDFFVKEKPVFTGITRGVGGFGFGKVSGGGGGGPIGFTVKVYNVNNVLQSTTPHSDVAPGTVYKYTDAGYYTIEIEQTSGDVEFQMWAWGAGGGTGAGPGPSIGGAGGGVRGTSTFSGGNTITFLVGGGGAFKTTTNNTTTSFPDGGNSGGSYPNGPGGGRSSIGSGLIPYPSRDSGGTQYLLIGGGGGGGTDYNTAGTLAGYGGYPSGADGGGYYSGGEPATSRGGGGSQSAGGTAGAAGRTPAGTAGAKYSGGDGPGSGSGGGGGFYGGGGGGGYYAMGGGGSGYIHPTLTDTSSFTTTPGSSNHMLALDDPSNPGTKPEYAGDSGYPSNPHGGMDGVVVFKVLQYVNNNYRLTFL